MSRELDALVAEKVMEFVKNARGQWHQKHNPPMATYHDMAMVPSYTTDVSADYEVLKHVREKWPKNEMEIDRFDKFLSALAQMWDERCRSFECGLSYGSGYGHGAKLGRMYEPGDYSKAALNALGVNTTTPKPSDSVVSEASEQVNK